jgi:hypothetical protein
MEREEPKLPAVRSIAWLGVIAVHVRNAMMLPTTTTTTPQTIHGKASGGPNGYDRSGAEDTKKTGRSRPT